MFWTQQQQHVSKDMRSRRFSATPVMRMASGMDKKSDSGSSLVSIDLGPSAVIDRRCSGGVEMMEIRRGSDLYRADSGNDTRSHVFRNEMLDSSSGSSKVDSDTGI